MVVDVAPPIASRIIGRVLVIDDDPGTLENFDRAYRRAGLEVATALKGPQGLELARRGCDLIVVDLRLPEMGPAAGLRLLERLRAEGISAPVVLMTAFGSETTAIEAKNLGAADYIDKPFEDPLYALRRVLPGASISHWDELKPLAPSDVDYRVQEVIRIIDRELSTRLSVEKLAERVFITPSRLRQLFREETGLPIARYVREKRLDVAAAFLTHTHMRISAIPYAIGFGNLAAFDKAFRRRFRMAPKEYRVTTR